MSLTVPEDDDEFALNANVLDQEADDEMTIDLEEMHGAPTQAETQQEINDLEEEADLPIEVLLQRIAAAEAAMDEDEDEIPAAAAPPPQSPGGADAAQADRSMDTYDAAAQPRDERMPDAQPPPPAATDDDSWDGRPDPAAARPGGAPKREATEPPVDIGAAHGRGGPGDDDDDDDDILEPEEKKFRAANDRSSPFSDPNPAMAPGDGVTAERILDEAIITDEEKRANPGFFAAGVVKTPAMYRMIRAHILRVWRETKPLFMTKTAARKGCRVDVNVVSSVYNYLSEIGAINFGAERPAQTRTTRNNNGGPVPRSLVFQPHRKKIKYKVPQAPPMDHPIPKVLYVPQTPTAPAGSDNVYYQGFLAVRSRVVCSVTVPWFQVMGSNGLDLTASGLALPTTIELTHKIKLTALKNALPPVFVVLEFAPSEAFQLRFDCLLKELQTDDVAGLASVGDERCVFFVPPGQFAKDTFHGKPSMLYGVMVERAYFSRKSRA